MMIVEAVYDHETRKRKHYISKGDYMAREADPTGEAKKAEDTSSVALLIPTKLHQVSLAEILETIILVH